MRDWAVTEVALADLASFLNNLEKLGPVVFQILDGATTRKTHVLVVSFVLSEPETKFEPVQQEAPPPSPAKPKKAKKGK